VGATKTVKLSTSDRWSRTVLRARHRLQKPSHFRPPSAKSGPCAKSAPPYRMAAGARAGDPRGRDPQKKRSQQVSSPAPARTQILGKSAPSRRRIGLLTGSRDSLAKKQTRLRAARSAARSCAFWRRWRLKQIIARDAGNSRE